MIISAGALTCLVGAALIATMITPVILLTLFIRDRKKGQLW